MSKNRLKIATIGGGSSYTPELIEGFIKRYAELPVKDIYLVDIEEGKEKLEIVGAMAKRMVKKSGVDITIHTTLNRREALDGADFVTTQFRVGLMDARIRDESIPLRYNVIGQETTGAGGFANALRTIPVILDICKDMKELCPDAWLINFTNPSGIITETVLNHTDIKAIGLCNVPIGMVSEFAEMYHVPNERVFVDFIGINHLLWGRKVFVNGKDVSEELVEKMANGSDEKLKNIPDIDVDPAFFKSLGMFPVDYLKYYYLTDEMLEECQKDAKTVGTRGQVVKKLEKGLFELYKDPNLNIKPKELAERGGAHYSDAACSLINSIYNSKGDMQTVNILNNGTIKDLPDNAVIERNCIIDGQGAHPLNVGYVPLKIRGLLQVVKAYEQLTIEAGVKGDYAAALQALTIHPLVSSSNIAIKLLHDIINENKDYLPQFKQAQ
jgi:6-phospho-beta-glucosidase